VRKNLLPALGIAAALIVAGVPSLPSRAEAKPSSGSCCMKGNRDACCCGVAGGCGMCRGEGMARTEWDDRSGALKLVRCPGPAEKRAEPAGGLRDIVPAPAAVAFLRSRAEFMTRERRHPPKDPSSVLELPPPRRSSAFSV